MANPNLTEPTKDAAAKDPQQNFDDSVSAYTTGNAEDRLDDRPEGYSRRFPGDFYRYSQDFHDRENGPPGIDEDFGTDAGRPDQANVRPVRTDEQRIHEEIMALLAENEDIGADDVSVLVEDGIVTLSGTVPKARAKTAIEERVQLVPGVEEVENCLIVEPPSGIAGSRLH